MVLTADRRSDELAEALRRHGAEVRLAPAMSTVQHADDDTLLEQTRALLADPPDVVVVTTGVGLRGWLEAADAAGLGEQLPECLRGARVLARGAKADGALRAVDVRAEFVAGSETTAEIVEHLVSAGCRGLRVAVQHHGADDDAARQALVAAGAEVRDLVVYRWGPAPDPELVRRSVAWAAGGEVDAVVFTSAPAARAWLAEADPATLAALRDRTGSDRLVLACVGPVTAAPLEQQGLRTLQPERFRMGALVKAIVARFTSGDTVLPGATASDASGH